MSTTTATASWGVSAGNGELSGVLVEYSESVEAILGTEQNEIGSVIGQAQYDEHTTVNATVQVPVDATPPEPGASITINGKSGYVRSAEIAESNTNYRRIRVTVECYRNCTETHTVS